MRQLADFLNGITLMAQAGLNDTKLRQHMDPAEREAYVQVLNSVEVTKLDRGDSKSVRAVLIVTPQAWATLSAVKAIPGGTPEPSRDHKSSVPQNKKDGTKTSAGNH